MVKAKAQLHEQNTGETAEMGANMLARGGKYHANPLFIAQLSLIVKSLRMAPDAIVVNDPNHVEGETSQRLDIIDQEGGNIKQRSRV